MTPLEAASGRDKLNDAFASSRRPRQQTTATDITPDVLLLEGKRLSDDVEKALTDGTLERTMEGASTLTLDIEDQDRDLERSGLFVSGKNKRGEPRLAPLRLSIPSPLGGIHFSLAKLSRQEDHLELTFEDAEIARLRQFTKPLKANRANTTRAEFVLKMLKEAKLKRWYIPELHLHQTIAGGHRPIKTQRDKPAKKRQDKAPGFAPGAKLKMKGATATKAQLSQAERALGVAESLNAPNLAMLALICAGIGESDFSPVVNSLGYGGVFQGQVETGGRYFSKDDTEQEAHYFLVGGKGFQGGGAIALSKRSGFSPGLIAAQVEGSGAGAGFYDIYRSEAEAILKAFNGGSAGSGGGTSEVTVVKKFLFTRGTGKKREDSWTAIQRLAQEVNWRAFVNEGWFYYVSEDTLFRTRPEMTLTEETPGVDRIEFDWDTGKAVAEATVKCRAQQWFADPGAVVVIDEPKSPVDGRWLVASVSRGIYDASCEVTLKKPMHEKDEPAPQTTTKTVKDRAGRSSTKVGDIKGHTPKEVIDEVVLPIGRKYGLKTPTGAALTPENVTAANNSHGPTVSGGRSDHQGPPGTAWAVDMSNGYNTPEEKKCADELAKLFGFAVGDSYQFPSVSHDGFRIQIGFRTTIGGNHFNHVHFGLRRE